MSEPDLPEGDDVPVDEPARLVADEPAPHRRSPLWRWLGVAAGAALVAFVGVGLWLAYKPVPDQLQGMVDAESYTIATKLPLSRVERLLVAEGDRVQAGQPLIVLSSPELSARRDQADAVLAGAQAAQARVVAGALPENIETLRAAAESADAALVLTEKTYVRVRNLYQEGVVPAQRLDEALAARDAARGHAEAAHQQVRRAVRGVPQQDKDVAQAQVKVAEAGVKEVQSLQGETHLAAPVSGEISHRLVRAGELVPLGFPVLTLVEVDKPSVVVNVRENQMHGLAAGRELTGRLPALDHQAVRFRVHSVGVQGEFATWRATRQSTGYDVRSFEVRLVPATPVPGLRPGMSVLFDWPQ
ncbi:MAG TPA: efflux RND transporter periplasmic adaptor subunit [Rhizobacter sp.]|nr:efflux RND transporter periplasmic adaptor subunit [Rhizobacter sp.]